MYLYFQVIFVFFLLPLLPYGKVQFRAIVDLVVYMTSLEV